MWSLWSCGHYGWTLAMTSYHYCCKSTTDRHATSRWHLTGDSVHYLLLCCVDTFLPLTLLHVHVECGHYVHSCHLQAQHNTTVWGVNIEHLLESQTCTTYTGSCIYSCKGNVEIWSYCSLCQRIQCKPQQKFKSCSIQWKMFTSGIFICWRLLRLCEESYKRHLLLSKMHSLLTWSRHGYTVDMTYKWCCVFQQLT